MSKIKFTMKFNRIATINTTKGPSAVGVVEEFFQNPDGSLNLVVELDPKLDKDIKIAIEKNPGVLGIMSVPQPVDDCIILP